MLNFTFQLKLSHSCYDTAQKSISSDDFRIIYVVVNDFRMNIFVRMKNEAVNIIKNANQSEIKWDAMTK